MEEVIQQQGWEPGRMPKAVQLQKAGQYGLVAAVRQMGGFKTIAGHLGLAPSPLDKRGRRKKVKQEDEAALQAQQRCLQAA